MIVKRHTIEQKRELVAKYVSRAKRLLNRASDALKTMSDCISTTQLVKLMDNIYKTQQILTQLKDDTDNLLRKFLKRDG